MNTIKKSFFAVFFLAITLATKNAGAQEKPNAPWTGDIHNVALQSKANFFKIQFFVSQTVWLVKNDKPNRVQVIEKGKEKGKVQMIDLRYELGAERKGTKTRVDSMAITFQKGSDTLSVMVPVLYISFDFGKCKKDKETIIIPFVLKPQFNQFGQLIDWHTSPSAQFEIAPFFSVNSLNADFTKKQEGVDYYRVQGKAVAQVDKEMVQILKTAVDKKVQ